MCWVTGNGREELAGVTLAVPFPLIQGYERLFDRQIGNISGMYVTLVPSWRERRRYVPMPQFRTIASCLGLVLGSSAENLMSGRTCRPFIPVCTGSGSGMQNPLAIDRGFQVNPLCRHDITSPFPPSGNEGYVCNRDVVGCQIWYFESILARKCMFLHAFVVFGTTWIV